MALCHSEQSEGSNHINPFQTLHGACPEPKIEILRFTQVRIDSYRGNRRRRSCDDKLGLFISHVFCVKK